MTADYSALSVMCRDVRGNNVNVNHMFSFEHSNIVNR